MRGLLLLGLLALPSLGACDITPERGCERSDERCEGAVAVQCREYDTPTGNGSRLVRTACSSADTCKADPSGVFCTLGAEPDPKCAPGSYCDGAAAVVCRSGYRIWWKQCITCSESECIGSVGQSCFEGGCVSGTTCIAGQCAATCDCAPGVECPPCAALRVTAGYRWTCEDHRCTEVETKP
ncbi:MAG: hypothetical protein HYZ29_07250 [Myxococcales bacterium]|nr:hypothetical protein [Myxococcales bacterium]